MLPEEAY
jgi:hypothetical protein